MAASLLQLLGLLAVIIGATVVAGVGGLVVAAGVVAVYVGLALDRATGGG